MSSLTNQGKSFWSSLVFGAQEKSSKEGGAADDVRTYEEESKPGSAGVLDYIPFISWNSKSDQVNSSARVFRSDPRTGPVDSDKAGRQYMYAADNGGRIPKSYFNDIRPQQAPQAPDSHEATPVSPELHVTPSTSSREELEYQTVTELPPEVMSSFVTAVRHSIERRQNVDDTIEKIERENHVSLSDETKQEIERSALIEISDESSESFQEATPKSRRRNRKRKSQKSAKDERSMAMGAETKSYGAPDESGDMDYSDVDNDGGDDTNENNGESNEDNDKEKDVFRQSEHEADTKTSGGNKDADAQESGGENQDILLTKNQTFVQSVFTDAWDENESFKIETSLPVPDMSELLLPRANSISSYSVIFERDERKQLDDLLKTIDDPEEFPTDAPQAQLQMITEPGDSAETTTNEIPFITGKIVEDDSGALTPPTETGTKTSAEDLKDIDQSLDDPNKRSDLDDPIEVHTEAMGVAAYYQGDSTIATDEVSTTAGSTEPSVDVMAMGGGPNALNAPIESEESDEVVTDAIAESATGPSDTNDGKEQDVSQQDEHEAETAVKESKESESTVQESKSEGEEIMTKDQSFVDSVFTDAGNDSESFVINNDLPVPDMSEILLPDANSLTSYSVIFDMNEEEQLREILDAIDRPAESPSGTTGSPQAQLSMVTETLPPLTTEDIPFVTGVTMVEEETDGPTKGIEEGTKTPMEDLKDIDESLDDPAKRSDLDDPTEAKTETVKVAAYYQGDSTETPESTTSDGAVLAELKEEIVTDALSSTTENSPFVTGMIDDEDEWKDIDISTEETAGSTQSDDYDWNVFDDDGGRPQTTTEPAPKQRQEPQPKPQSQSQTPQRGDHHGNPKPEPQYSTPQLQATEAPGKSFSQPGPGPEAEEMAGDEKKQTNQQQGQKERRKTFMPSEDDDEGSFWDDAPKKKQGERKKF